MTKPAGELQNVNPETVRFKLSGKQICGIVASAIAIGGYFTNFRSEFIGVGKQVTELKTEVSMIKTNLSQLPDIQRDATSIKRQLLDIRRQLEGKPPPKAGASGFGSIDVDDLAVQ